jgi:hypothetical protein
MFKIHQLLDFDGSCRPFCVVAAPWSQLEPQKNGIVHVWFFFHGSLGPIPVPGPKFL